MRIPFVFAMICGVGAGASALGQMPKPIPKLIAARAEYQKHLDKTQSAFEESAKVDATEYKKVLVALLEEETKAGRLDAAVAIRDEIKLLEAEITPIPKTSNKVAFQRVLTGTRWNWGGEPLTFQAGGVAKHAGWERAGMVTRWEAIDRRTVVLYIEKGRDQDRTAILEFSEALDEFKGIDFIGAKRFDAKKRWTGK